ncbi:MAG: hypothetical protein IT303_20595 [Dehalococcoidia bacterium]|nr:hypothetical protein [Dehalococcoidia bacterium]
MLYLVSATSPRIAILHSRKGFHIDEHSNRALERGAEYARLLRETTEKDTPRNGGRAPIFLFTRRRHPAHASGVPPLAD